MFLIRQIFVLLSITVLAYHAYAQQRGEIIKSGDEVLDPDGDGYITSSGGVFSIDNYYVDEFELNMFGIPIVGDGDVSGDVQAGQVCGVTDLSVDTAGYSVYGVLEAGNLIFRFRIGDDKPSVQSYSILIDTDNRIGADDPNATGDNPGFELLISLIKNQNKGIYVYNIDGVEGCPDPVAVYPFNTHFQSSVAGTTSCNDADYFYDYYIPFQVLNDQFQITQQSELRFVGVTNVSATCAFGGSISDVGGVDDSEYANLVDMFVALTESQCPTALEDLCQSCEGFASGNTEKPIINQPVKVGENVISGTSELEANIFVSVFSDNGSLVEDIVGAADIEGNWELPLSNPLADGDSITARAQVIGGCASGISESDLSYALVIINTPAVIGGSTSTLTYTENGDPITIFDNFSISDIDDVEMDSAWLTVTLNYNLGEDVITLPSSQGLNISWEPAMDRVRIYGKASLADYETVIKGITYANSSEDPDESTREFSVQVHDGLDLSNTITRSIAVSSINDPPVLTGEAATIGYLETDVDVVIDNTISISDLDGTSLSEVIVSFTQGYDMDEDTLQFVNQNGITGIFDDVNGVLNLSGVASLNDYQVALASLKYENLDAGNNAIEVIDDPTTRIISFQLNDGTDLSNLLLVNIDIDVSTNSAPVFVDNLTDLNPVDTIIIDLLEDTVLDTCLVAFDADGDPVNLQPGFTYENNEGVATLTEGLCFSFTPNDNFDDVEYLSFTGCDDVAMDVLCDDVVVKINMIPVNDSPNIVDTNNNSIDTVYFSTMEDTPKNFCLDAIGVDATDIESNTLAFSSAISLSGNANSSIPDASLFCFDFTPDQDFFGFDTLQLVVCEQGSATQCDTIIAIIEVIPSNDAPQIQVDGLPVDTIYFEALEDVITEMCVDASDPDMDNLQVESANLTEGPGIFEARPFGDLCWFFQSLKDSTGMVYGEVIVCDNANPALCDTIIAAVNVIPVNDHPLITDENGNPLFEDFDTLYYTIDEDQPIDFCISASDADGDPLILDGVISIDGNGSFIITDPTGLCVNYTPDPDFNGNDQGTLTVCESSGVDPQCVSITVVFDVISVNDPPVITNGGVPVDTLYYQIDEDNPIDICLTVDDADGNTLNIEEINASSMDGVFDIGDPLDLCFLFTPDLNFNGDTYAEVIVCDDQNPSLCDTVIVALEVIPVNDPPMFINKNIINDTLLIETVEDTSIEFCFDIIDPENQSITDPVISSITNLGDYDYTKGLQDCYVFTPLNETNGVEYATVTVCDDTNLCAELVVEIVIAYVNDPPIGEDDFFEHDIYTIFTGNITENDSDIEGTRLTASIEDGSQLHGELDLDQSGTFRYNPSRSFVGTEVFTYRLCDTGVDPQCTIVTVTFELNDPLTVWQAVSPNGDGMNDQWVIEGIELFPDNRIQIYDRYNNLVYEITGYNNQDKVWSGQSNRGITSGNETNGTYFYKIDLGDEKIGKPLSGFIILKKD